MADELLTVLDADPEAREGTLDVEDEDLRRLYEYLLLVRAVDERGEELLESGRMRFFVPAGSHAAASLGGADALDDDDWLYPSYRDFPAWLRRGGSLRNLVAQLLGSAGDPLHVRQLPGHLSLPEGRFVAVSGPVATHLGQAVGTALALRKRERPAIVLANLGRAAAARGACASALREAGRRRAPVVFGWRGRSDDPAALAAAHGIPVTRVDGGDVLAVRVAVVRARERALEGEGPHLVVARLPEQEEDAATRLRRFLERRGSWEADWQEEVDRRCREVLAEALQRADSEGLPEPATALDDITARRAWMLREQGELLSARSSED